MRPALLLFFLCAISAAQAQATHYAVRLRPDFDHQLLHGEETIEFEHGGGEIQWQKQRGLEITQTKATEGKVALADESVTLRLTAGGRHRVHFEYTAGTARGIKWFASGAGFDAAFYCEDWMICDNSPAQRATLSLEIILPNSGGLSAVGPGQLKKLWRDKDGDHFVFEQNNPVQTYLFSFGVAKLNRLQDGNSVLYVMDTAEHRTVFAKAADAYTFLRGKASVDLMDRQYTQAFLPDDIAQEAGGMALMSADYLANLEAKDNVLTMSHELAHQWWGVLVGIRSWSDFWLNEGIADFMMDAYVEQHQGRAAYDQRIARTRERMNRLREQGQDRPLHWEGWKDSHEALGQIPYVKGALFLDRLRAKMGEQNFWRGIALYTSRNASRLVDSSDFEHAMEEASGRDLKALFDEEVYH